MVSCSALKSRTFDCCLAPFPPDKDTFVTYAKNIKTPSKKPLGIDDFDHLPDKDWLVKLLSTYKPDSRIFSKDYVPPPRVKKIDA